MSETANTKIWNKQVRVLSEHGERIEKAATGCAVTANQILVKLAVEAPDQQGFVNTEARLQVASASLLPGQGACQNVGLNGWERGVEQTQKHMLTINDQSKA